MSQRRFEVGETVYVTGRYGEIWQGLGEIVELLDQCYIVKIGNRTGGFYAEDLLAEEIYNSPLFKALSEE